MILVDKIDTFYLDIHICAGCLFVRGVVNKNSKLLVSAIFILGTQIVLVGSSDVALTTVPSSFNIKVGCELGDAFITIGKQFHAGLGLSLDALLPSMYIQADPFNGCAVQASGLGLYMQTYVSSLAIIVTAAGYLGYVCYKAYRVQQDEQLRVKQAVSDLLNDQ